MLRMTLQMCEQGLLMVYTEAFLVEEGVFECMNVRDMDLLSRFELVEPMGGVGKGSKEAA